MPAPSPTPTTMVSEERGGSVRWVLLACGVAFLLALAANVRARDVEEALACAVLAGVGLGGFFLMQRSRAKRAAFVAWLSSHAKEIAAGKPAEYEGQPIRLDTRVRRFEASISMILFSSRFSSHYCIDGHPSTGALSATFTGVSLLFGWWGIPFGPVFTVMAIVRNLRGGHVVTVGQLLSMRTA